MMIYYLFLFSYPWMYSLHNQTFSSRWNGSSIAIRVSISICGKKNKFLDFEDLMGIIFKINI